MLTKEYREYESLKCEKLGVSLATIDIVAAYLRVHAIPRAEILSFVEQQQAKIEAIDLKVRANLMRDAAPVAGGKDVP